VLAKVRPAGITRIAVLQSLLGLFSLGGALIAFLVAGICGPYCFLTFDFAFSGIGIWLAISGLVGLFVGQRMSTGKGWVWTYGVVAGIIGAVIATVVMSIGVIGSLIGSDEISFYQIVIPYLAPGFVIQLIILFYLTRPHVRAFFGKGGAPYVPLLSSTAQEPPTTPQPAP